jgi:hypothetical protein
MGTNMKYYIYISDAKVNQLYEHIDESLLKRIAVELSIDLRPLPLPLGVGGTIKLDPVKDTRISRLRLVVKSLEGKKEISGIDAPDIYFKGSLPMQWGLVYSGQEANGEPPYAVQFSSRTDRTAVGMIGSLHHMIGNPPDASNMKPLWYTKHEILKTLASTTERPTSLNDEYLQNVVSELLSGTSIESLRQERPLEFLAVNYYFKRSKGPNELDFLLGTPIYVAFAD